METKGKTDTSESKARTINKLSSSDCILGCGRHTVEEIDGGRSDCELKSIRILRYTHPTVAGNQDEAAWHIIEYNSVHP